MLPLFRAGLGGPLGNGKQWMSWIALDDTVGAHYWTLLDDRISGPVNVVAPEPVTNRDFTRTLAATLSRPAFMPAPAWALRLAVGELADEGLLASAKVYPDRLLDSGYVFRYPSLDQAMAHVLSRTGAKS